MLIKLARDGVNILIDGLEAAYNVRPVMVKWKAANVDWFNRSLGSAKMALFVKTCLCQYKVRLSLALSPPVVPGNVFHHPIPKMKADLLPSCFPHLGRTI
jgi:hypothetical protein